MPKITIELEIEDVSKSMILFESIGEIGGLEMCRTIPMGSPIIYTADGKRRYMIDIRKVYQALAHEIIAGSLKQPD